MRGEEAVRPSLMVPHPTPTPRRPETLAQHGAHTPTNPRVEGLEGAVAVFEVRKPATERAVDVVDDDREAVPVRATRLLSHRSFEFRQALPTRTPIRPREVIAEKFKAARLLHIHEMGFLGMQLHARRHRPALHERQRLLRIVCRATQVL